jgi:hypothetical protein
MSFYKIKCLLIKRLNITEDQINNLIELLGLTEEQLKGLLQEYNVTEEEVNKLIEELIDHFKNPINIIKIISKDLEDFENKVEKANKAYGSKRKKYIEDCIVSLNNIFNMNFFQNNFVENFISGKKPIIEDQLEFWKNELVQLPKIEDKFLRIDINFRLKEIKSTVESLKHKIDFFEKTPSFYYKLKDKKPFFIFKDRLNEINYLRKNLKIVIAFLEEDIHNKYILEINSDLNYILSCVKSKEDTIELKKIQNIIRDVDSSKTNFENKAKIKFHDFFNDDLPLNTIERIKDFSLDYSG